MFVDILDGLQQALQWKVLGAVSIGVFIGLWFGALPGLSTAVGVAILAPLAMNFPPLLSIAFLVGVYRGGIYGGAIPSILIGIPGTAATVPTVIDGYELTKQGYPHTAMQASLTGAALGAFISSSMVMLLIAPLGSIALSIGAPEMFGLLLFSITLVAYVSGNRIAKGLIAGSIGFCLALVGLDPVLGTPRFTMGVPQLFGGISLIPLFIGMFALPELFDMLERRIAVRRTMHRADRQVPRIAQRAADDILRMRDIARRYWKTILHSSFVGSFIGVLPGIGEETAPWISYSIAKRFSKRSKNFGKGEPEGVVACEVSSDAVVAATFVPLLLFGVPGSVVAAVFIGILNSQGIRPGPELLNDPSNILFGIVATAFVSSILLYLIVRPLTPLFAAFVKLPDWITLPLIASLCVTGAYAINNDPFDVQIMVAAGLLGWLLRKLAVPVAPLVLTFVLAPPLEAAFRQTLLIDSSGLILLTEPVAAGFLLIALAVAISSTLRKSTAGLAADTTEEELQQA